MHNQFLDIHVHNWYEDPDIRIVLNTFPEEPKKLELPVQLSVGLHPWHVQESSWQEKMDRIRHLAALPSVIAIGETGLDKIINTDFALQTKVFENHIIIAAKFRKPLIIHCVRSYSEMLALRKKSDLHIPWIFHWFNADIQMARDLIHKNCYLSFGTMLFNERSKAFKAFPDLPADRIFFETDDTGINICEVYERAAQLRNTDIDSLKIQIMNNFANCFHE